MGFIESKLYKMFYKESMGVNTQFKILNLLPCRGRPRNINKIKLTPLYKNVRPILTPRHKDNLTHNINEEK